MHKVANKLFGSPIFGFHHGVVFLLGIVALFGIIRWYNELNIISYMGLVLAASIALIVPLCEFLALSTLREKAEFLVEQIKMRNKRSSMVGKTVRSFWLVKNDAGLPFYTVSNDTILTYMERLTGFLIDVLMTIP